jgi:hypothetical protein
MLRKVIKDIVYCTVKDLKSGSIENAFTINGICLIDYKIEDGIEVLKKFGLIKEDVVVIPAGFIVNKRKFCGGAEEFTFNDGLIKVDLMLDNDDEYLSKDVAELMKHNSEDLLIAAIANMILENHSDDVEDIDEALSMANDMIINKGALNDIDIMIRNYLEDR